VAVNPGPIATKRMTKLLKRRAVNLPAGEARRQEVLADYPGGRMGEPGEAADLMVFIASSRAACVSVAVFPIDGGLASFGSIIKPRPRNGDAAGR
jgi:NAD(P)-dependent dehydrogenase (short-subunit alcohol dehydrogenase family)